MKRWVSLIWMIFLFFYFIWIFVLPRLNAVVGGIS